MRRLLDPQGEFPFQLPEEEEPHLETGWLTRRVLEVAAEWLITARPTWTFPRAVEISEPELGPLAIASPWVLGLFLDAGEPATLDAQLAEVRLARYRQDRLRFRGWYGEPEERPSDELLEEVCPLEEMRRRLPRFVRPAPDPVAALPLGLLLLADDHPAFRRLRPTAPIGEALSWARREGSKQAAKLLAAAARFRLERYWEQYAATLCNANVPPYTWAAQLYDATMDALHSLYAARILEVPLAELDISRGSLGRLARGLEKSRQDAPPPPYTLRDLPRFWSAFRLPGVGTKTESEIIDKLRVWLVGWRERVSGISHLGDEARRADEGSRAAIKEGLDELEALFDL